MRIASFVLLVATASMCALGGGCGSSGDDPPTGLFVANSSGSLESIVFLHVWDETETFEVVPAIPVGPLGPGDAAEFVTLAPGTYVFYAEYTSGAESTIAIPDFGPFTFADGDSMTIVFEL
jgi:hypothetical protein